LAEVEPDSEENAGGFAETTGRAFHEEESSIGKLLVSFSSSARPYLARPTRHRHRREFFRFRRDRSREPRRETEGKGERERERERESCGSPVASRDARSSRETVTFRCVLFAERRLHLIPADLHPPHAMFPLFPRRCPSGNASLLGRFETVESRESTETASGLLASVLNDGVLARRLSSSGISSRQTRRIRRFIP